MGCDRLIVFAYRKLFVLVVLEKARTSFFIDHLVGFSFVNTVAEAHWRSGSATHLISFANRKASGPLNPFLSDKAHRLRWVPR